MKKLTLSLFGLFLLISSYSQVFNTASTLKPLKFSIGLNPVVVEENFGLFLHGGMGIKSGLDLSVKYGIFEGNDYFGADLEWGLINNSVDISLTTGIHNFDEFGLDVALNFSFDIRKDIHLYTGFDTDLVFYDDAELFVWIPVGVEIGIKNGMSLILEAEIPVNNQAYSVFGGGLAFYF